jgi:heat-inducible transcriptional repressor
LKDEKKRRDQIIDAVVNRYLENAEPVSSAHVCEHSGLGLSPASIRAIMKDLEEEGFFIQPHTSAGRIPTVKCYRYYVKHLMPHIDLVESDIAGMRSKISEYMLLERDAELFMNHVASSLSEITDLIGVAMFPVFDLGVFDRIEIVPISSSSRYIIIVSLKTGMVKTINITVDHLIPRRKVEETARLLTSRLNGLTVSEIKYSIGSRLCDITGGDHNLLDIILSKSDFIFGFSEDRGVHLAGLSRLLSHSDFAGTADYSLRLASLFEHKIEIAEAIRNSVPDFEDVSIHIGGRGTWGHYPPLSLVSAVYHSGNSEGAIAVIGPARIHYQRLSSIVKYTASMASLFFSS